MTSAARAAMVWLAWALALGLFVVRILVYPLTSDGVDFGKHWIAAGVVLAGGSPYEGELFLSFNYPLLVAFLYAPLDYFTLPVAERIFDSLNFLYLLAGSLLMGAALRPSVSEERWWIRAFWGPCILLTFALSDSARRLTWSGNIDGLVVLLLCCFMTAIVSGKERLAGVALALVVLVKAPPVLFLLPLVALRKWRCVATMVGVIAAYWVVLLATGWAATEVALYRDVLPAIPWFWRNISIGIHSSVAEYVIGWGNLTEAKYKLLILGLNGAMMSGLMALVWYRWPAVKNSPARIMVLSSQWLVAFVPLLEINHIAWVIPGLVLGVREWAEGRIATRSMLPWIISCAALLVLDTLGQMTRYIDFTGVYIHLTMTLIVVQSVIFASVYTLFSDHEPVSQP